jgi:signal peptidase
VTRSDPDPGGGPTAAVVVVAWVATAALASFACLVLWTLIPLIFGWSSSVVLTGSMHPQIDPGDVVVCSPIKQAQIRVGSVIRFNDPAIQGRMLLHRVAAFDVNGSLRTKGDANERADSTPVPPASVVGLGRLRVPYVALPVIWWRNAEYLKLAAVAAVFVFLCAAAPFAFGPGPRASRSRTPPRHRRTGRRGAPPPRPGDPSGRE